MNGSLALHAAAIRGFENGGGLAILSAASISMDNLGGATAPAPGGVPAGDP